MAVHSTSNRKASRPRRYHIASTAPSTSAGARIDQRQVGAALVVLQPIEQGGAVVRAVVLAAADPRLQAQAMAVVDQQADDAGMLLQRAGSAPRRSAAARARRRRRRRPGRHAPAPRPANPGPGRGRRCGPGTPARPAARRWTGWRRSTTRPDRPAATRPAPGPSATTGGGPRHPGGSGSGGHRATAPRAAASPAGRRRPAPGAHRPPARRHRRCRIGRSPRAAAGPLCCRWSTTAAAMRVRPAGSPRRTQQRDRRLVDGLRQLRVGEVPLVRAQAQRAEPARRRAGDPRPTACGSAA